MEGNSFCDQVLPVLSAFVDALVDHAVSGEFVGPVVPESVVPFKPLLQTDEELAELKKPPWERKSPPVQSFVPAIPHRIIAIGDLHGDLKKTRDALKLAKLVDENNRWIAGETTLVQVGDIMDRGGDEIKILHLMERLKREASRAGGQVHVLQGNHELSNAEGRFQYAHYNGVKEFYKWACWYEMGQVLKGKCTGLLQSHDFYKDIPTTVTMQGKTELGLNTYQMSRGFKFRLAALRPGGPISSRFLASNPTVLVVGENIFVHGGLNPDYHPNPPKINHDVREWLLGKEKWMEPLSTGTHLEGSARNTSCVWLRKFSNTKLEEVDCDLLERALRIVPGAKRIVMGHTVQEEGINSTCNKRSVRIDVGMSRGMNDNSAEVLEIRNGELSVIDANGRRPVIDYRAERVVKPAEKLAPGVAEKQKAGTPEGHTRLTRSRSKLERNKARSSKAASSEPPDPSESLSPRLLDQRSLANSAAGISEAQPVKPEMRDEAKASNAASLDLNEGSTANPGIVSSPPNETKTKQDGKRKRSDRKRTDVAKFPLSPTPPAKKGIPERFKSFFFPGKDNKDKGL